MTLIFKTQYLRKYAARAALSGLVVSASLSMAIPSFAAEPQLVGTFGKWAAYTRSDNGDKVCYVLAEPSKKTPGSVKHGDIFFMVSNWKSGSASEQPSFVAGYPLKVTSPPTAIVGSHRERMFVSQNEGFIKDNGDERSLVKRMRAGANMRVSAVSHRGTAVSYEFSLKGVTAALAKAKSSCS